jgi:hypothetical protein
MLQIDSCRPPALELLALDFAARSAPPGLPFCRRVAQVPGPDQQIARRLGVPVAMVRGWRAVGRR